MLRVNSCICWHPSLRTGMTGGLRLFDLKRVVMPRKSLSDGSAVHGPGKARQDLNPQAPRE